MFTSFKNGLNSLSLLLVTFSLTSFSSNDDQILRVLARVLLPILIIGIIGLIANPIRNKKNRERKNRSDEFIEKLKNEQKLNSLNDADQEAFSIKYRVKVIQGIFQIGCLIFGIGLFISWFFFWWGLFYDNKVFIYIFLFFLLATILWSSFNSLLKKEIHVILEFRKGALIVYNLEKDKFLNLLPEDILSLELFENSTNNKGLTQTTGIYINLQLNINFYKEDPQKWALFYELLGQHKLSEDAWKDHFEKKQSYASERKDEIENERREWEWLIGIGNSVDYTFTWNEYKPFSGRTKIFGNYGKPLREEIIKFSVNNDIKIYNR